jgi:hypothetical protein
MSDPAQELQAQLAALEEALRQQWRLGQNITLCWCPRPEGIHLLFAPHYFLGNFSASLSDASPIDRLELLNGRFIRKLISGRRLMDAEDFFSTARRLQLEPSLIPSPLGSSLAPAVLEAVERMVKRYSISHVESRAVLLLDIVDFSLFSPFEQTSQLNSLSYSLNSASNKLRAKGIAVDFARTTTGDGFYVWNRDLSPRANMDLFLFMLVTIADNAMARRRARGNTVPLLRTAFHIGSHFEFSQVEGMNPTLYSYIVGDVTIELARMVEIARAGQIFIGEFDTAVPTSGREAAFLVNVDSDHFVQRAGKRLESLRGLEFSGERVESIHCQLTGETGVSAGRNVRRFRITDKHGRSRHAYNLRINIHIAAEGNGGHPLLLGIQGSELPRAERGRRDAADLGRRGRRHRPLLLPEE